MRIQAITTEAQRHKVAKALLLMAFASLWLCPSARAAMILNAAGIGGAPVTVAACGCGFTTVIAAAGDIDWTLQSENGDLRCVWGDALGTAPNAEPSATVGWLIPYIKGQVTKETGINARMRLDCCGVSGPTAVDTAEEK